MSGGMKEEPAFALVVDACGHVIGAINDQELADRAAAAFPGVTVVKSSRRLNTERCEHCYPLKLPVALALMTS